MMSFPSQEGRRVVRSRFGVLLRTYREGHSPALTQGQLANATGYSMALISRLESGQRRPSRDVVDKLAAALRLTHDQTQQLLRTAGLSVEGALDDVTHLTDAILVDDPRDLIIRGLVQSDISTQADAWRALTAASRKMREGELPAVVPVFRSLLPRRELSRTLRIYAARKLCEAYRRLGDLPRARAALTRGERLLDSLIVGDKSTRRRTATGDMADRANRESWPIGFLRGSLTALHGEIEETGGEYETARGHYQTSLANYIALRNSLPEGAHRDAAQLGVVRALIRLAKISNLLGENDAALVLCEQAKNELSHVPPSWQHEDASRKLKAVAASAHARNLDFDRAIELHHAALRDAEQSGAPAVILLNLLFLGDDYRRRIEARLDDARRNPHTRRLERSSRQVLNSMEFRGPDDAPGDREIAEWLDAAERYYDEAERVYRMGKTTTSRGHLLTSKAIAARYRGHFDEAETLLLQALEEELSNGPTPRLSSVYTALGDVAWDRDMFQQAAYWYKRAQKELGGDEGSRYRARNEHLIRVEESLRAVERRLHVGAGATYRHADLASDWHLARNKLIHLVRDRIIATQVRPLTEDATDPLWLAEMADFEALPGGRVLAQNALSNSLLERLPDDVPAASQAQHQRRRAQFLANVRAAQR